MGEKDEKDAAVKKEKEDKLKKEQANKKEINEQKNTDKNIKKKTSTVTTKIKTKETITKTRKTEVSNDITTSSTSSRKIMPTKPMMTKSSTPPSSKLKKDENNKKVMETRKAAFAAKTQKAKGDNEEKIKSKKIIGSKLRNIPGSKTSGKASSTLTEEERKVDEKSVAEKVSEAIASGEIDDSRVVKDDDDDKESIVEKDQIEEMETCPVDDLETGKDFVKENEDDEDDIELQRIKDEDDEVEENLAPVPDIAEKMNDVAKESKKELEQKNVPSNLTLEKEKISYSHVKTPDEVDDLPEHEVVVPDSHVMDEIKSEMSGDLEEKIALDESEKESDARKKDAVNEKSEGSVEAVRDNEIVEVAVEQKCMQVEATTPLNENQGKDFLKEMHEPEFKEEQQYLTTDKDELNIAKPNESSPAVDTSKDTEDDDFTIKPGILKVIVFKGSELVNKDIIGKSDPFLKIKFREQEIKSPKVRNSLEPEWNFSANLTISSSQENSDIFIEVFDDDFGKENFIGSYNFTLKQAISSTDKEASWNNLVGCKTGKISVSTFYSPTDAQGEEDNDANENNEKDIDRTNEEVENKKHEDVLETKEKCEDKTDATGKTEEDKEDKRKESLKEIKEPEISPIVKDLEKDDKIKDKSESSSHEDSQSSDKDLKNNLDGENKEAVSPIEDKSKEEVSADRKHSIKIENKNLEQDLEEESNKTVTLKEEKSTDEKSDSRKQSLKIEENLEEEVTEKGSLECKEEKDSVSKDDAPDSFINDIYTTEGRQSSPEKEIEKSKEEDEKIKDIAPDSFINDIYLTEGRQSGIDKELNEMEQDEEDKQSEDEYPMIKPGMLKIIVFKGSELENKDMIGKSDPFLKIKFRDQELKSQKVRNSLEPEWNFSANLSISSSQDNSDIIIEVYDDDFGKENFIGSYTFPLGHAIKHTDEEASWNNLTGCKTGKISFATFYSPSDDNDQAEDNEEEAKETTKDSFINDIYTVEGRQSDTSEKEKVEIQKESEQSSECESDNKKDDKEKDSIKEKKETTESNEKDQEKFNETSDKTELKGGEVVKTTNQT